MKDLIKSVFLFRLSVFYFLLFSINALCTCFTAAFAGTNWEELSNTGKALVIAAMIANWSTTMLAFVNKQIARVSSGKPPGLDTASPFPPNAS